MSEQCRKWVSGPGVTGHTCLHPLPCPFHQEKHGDSCEVDIDSITPKDKNVVCPPDMLETIIKFGQVCPVLVDDPISRTIVSTGRMWAGLKQLGQKRVRVIFANGQ